MTTPEFLIVGRVRKAHGIHGELVVEPITDGPDAIFAPGRRVLAGTHTGELPTHPRELHVSTVRPMGDGFLVKFDEVPDRTAADTWRGRYLLLPSAEVPPPDEHEIYVHDLLGMRVVLASGELVGDVEEVYELPQGLALDIRRARGTVMVPFDDRVVTAVDREARLITIDPPAGLLD